MNILFIAHYPHLYGSIRSSLDLADGLRAQGVTPFFIIPGQGSLSQQLEQHQTRYEILHVPRWMAEKPAGFIQQVHLLCEISQSARSIRSLIQRWDIDVVYTNTSIIPVGRLASRRARIPHIWHIREFGDLDFSLHYIFPKSLSKAYIKSSNAVICHAKVVRDHHFKPGTPNVHQVYNGCATHDQFDKRLRVRNASQPHGDYTFSMLSTITPKKGQEEAIRALAVLRKNGLKTRLLIAGSGKPDYIDGLHQLACDLHIGSAVEFTGFVEDPFPLYFASDCALVCSEHEALSRAGLEAMSTALPLIGRNSGGNTEIIVHSETGYLYNTFDDLVEYMTCLVQNPELGRQMGLSGWQRAKDMFNIEDYASNVYKVIQSVMQQ